MSAASEPSSATAHRASGHVDWAGVDEDDSGDLVEELRGERDGLGTAEGVPDHDVGPRLVDRGEQLAEVRGLGGEGRRDDGRIARAGAWSVVGAHSGSLRDGGLELSPTRRSSPRIRRSTGRSWHHCRCSGREPVHHRRGPARRSSRWAVPRACVDVLVVVGVVVGVGAAPLDGAVEVVGAATESTVLGAADGLEVGVSAAWVAPSVPQAAVLASVAPRMAKLIRRRRRRLELNVVVLMGANIGLRPGGPHRPTHLRSRIADRADTAHR